MKDIASIDWAALRAPFNPEEVDFRLQSTYEKDGKVKGIAIAYMDARLVQDRLDEVVGPENWSFDWQPMATKDNAVIAAKGTLTICGVSKSDIGDCDATEKNKASVSDAEKRAAVQWGIGRYLYGLGTFFCETEKRGKSDVIPEAEVRKMRGKLPRPDGYKAPQAAPVAPPPQSTPRPPAATAQPARAVTGNVQTGPDALATDRQVTSIRKLCAALQRPEPDLATMTFAAARDVLTQLSHDYTEARQAVQA